ncbi:MAG: CBS domain-containing protein [Nitrosopumilus sp.]|nr:CBS domain-containing protein [Nitrosopumilus sp.]
MTKSLIPVSLFMTKKIHTIQSSESIQSAAKFFYEKDISSLMVLDGDKLVGIITEKDLVTSALVFDHEKNISIKDIMTPSPICITPDTSLLEVAHLMTEKKFHKFPVLENNKIVGLISATDLVVIFSMTKEEDLVKVLGPQLGLE